MNTFAFLCFVSCIAVTLQCGSSVKPRVTPPTPQVPGKLTTVLPVATPKVTPVTQAPVTPVTQAPVVPTVAPTPKPTICECETVTVLNTPATVPAALIGTPTNCELTVTCESKTAGMETLINFNAGTLTAAMSPAKTNPDPNVVTLKCNAAMKKWETAAGVAVDNAGCIEQAVPATAVCECDATTVASAPGTPAAMVGKHANCKLPITCVSQTNAMETIVNLNPGTATEEKNTPKTNPDPNVVELTCNAATKKWESAAGLVVDTAGCIEQAPTPAAVCECDATMVTTTPPTTPPAMVGKHANCMLPITCESPTLGMETLINYNPGTAAAAMSAPSTNPTKNEVMLTCNAGTKKWETAAGVVVDNAGCIERAPAAVCECDAAMVTATPATTPPAMVGTHANCMLPITCESPTLNMETLINLNPGTANEEMLAANPNPAKSEVMLTCNVAMKKWQSPGGKIVDNAGCIERAPAPVCACAAAVVTTTPPTTPPAMVGTPTNCMLPITCESPTLNMETIINYNAGTAAAAMSAPATNPTKNEVMLTCNVAMAKWETAAGVIVDNAGCIEQTIGG